MAYQPKTGERCSCKPGLQRDNCPACEGTGHRIDFAAIRARNAQSVTRYVPTYVNKDGMRTLMRAAQGRDTFATADEAQQWIDSVVSVSSDSVAQIWGSNPQFAVRPCPCWPVHHDPQTVWFDSEFPITLIGDQGHAEAQKATVGRLTRKSK